MEGNQRLRTRYGKSGGTEIKYNLSQKLPVFIWAAFFVFTPTKKCINMEVEFIQ